MSDGWIKLHRQILDHDLWIQEPFTRGQAWVDLLLLANHKQSSFRMRGILVVVERGQVGLSEENLGKRWKWSRGKVRRFLSEMEHETVQMIVQQKSSCKSIISIVNYDSYQSDGTTDGTQVDTTNGHQTVQQTDTNKNDKNEKKKTNTVVSVPETLAIIPGFVMAWEKWLEHLRQKRKPPTTLAMVGQLKKLESIQDPINAINHSIENNWQGIFEPRPQANKKPDVIDEIKRVDELMRKKYGIETAGKDHPRAAQPMLCSATQLPETGDSGGGDSDNWQRMHGDTD